MVLLEGSALTHWVGMEMFGSYSGKSFAPSIYLETAIHLFYTVVFMALFLWRTNPRLSVCRIGFAGTYSMLCCPWSFHAWLVCCRLHLYQTGANTQLNIWSPDSLEMTLRLERPDVAISMGAETWGNSSGRTTIGTCARLDLFSEDEVSAVGVSSSGLNLPSYLVIGWTRFWWWLCSFVTTVM